jgi:hypothetical protein
MEVKRKLLVVEVAALGWDLVREHAGLLAPLGLSFSPLRPRFPAVTCTVQAAVRTGLPSPANGMPSNGVYDRALRRTLFWEQSAALLAPGRVWESLRGRGGRVGTLFWQQSLGDGTDLVLSPAPIHKHHGGMIQDCYAKPAGLYQELCAGIGRPFDLMRYWGPLAGLPATRWITDATLAVLRSPQPAPELLLTYLPHLDYALQKHGPENRRRTARAVTELAGELGRLLAGARNAGYDVWVFGDYAITPARQVVYPNRALRQAGLLAVRQVGRQTYPDFHGSRALAMVDHQAAHVFVQGGAAAHKTARTVLAALPGVAEVRDGDGGAGGDLVLVADPGAWFAYPWWDAPAEAPDYAGHVDIHSKPGFDPCELFWGWPPGRTGQTPAKVRGTHGRDDAPAAFAALTAAPLPPPAGHLELAAALRAWCRTA